MAYISNSKLLNNGAGILKKDACVVLVRTEWNAAVVDELEKGALAGLAKQGVKKIKTLIVPGGGRRDTFRNQKLLV